MYINAFSAPLQSIPLIAFSALTNNLEYYLLQISTKLNKSTRHAERERESSLTENPNCSTISYLYTSKKTYQIINLQKNKCNTNRHF